MAGTWLQEAGRRVSERLGREGPLVRLLRPAYERALDVATLGRGYLRVVNGRERCYVRPSARGLFPEVYEPEACDYLRSRVRPGSVCLNVGAHVGIYALCLAEWSKPDGMVAAFEPNPATRAVLADHVRRNGLGGRVVVEALAVGGRIGTADLAAAPLSGTARLGVPNPESDLVHERVPVEVCTLDAYCGARALEPDWIVMDIEGCEVEALAGARGVLASGRGRLGLVVELHPHLWCLAGTGRGELERLLGEAGLEARALTGQRDPLQEPGVVALEWVRPPARA